MVCPAEPDRACAATCSHALERRTYVQDGVAHSQVRQPTLHTGGCSVATNVLVLLEEFESFHGRRALGRAHKRLLRPSGHPRQPYQAWWNSRCGSVPHPIVFPACIVGMDVCARMKPNNTASSLRRTISRYNWSKTRSRPRSSSSLRDGVPCRDGAAALDFVAPLAYLPVVFPGVAPGLERRNYGCEAESRWRVASPS